MAARGGRSRFLGVEGRRLGPGFFGFRGRSAARRPVFLLCGRTSPPEPSDALEVVGELGHADLDTSTGDADGADEQMPS